jgi:hypothetical protein
MKKMLNVIPMMMADNGVAGGVATMLDKEVQGKMKRSKISKSIRSMIKNKNNIRTDLAIQRNYVWNPEKAERASLLIHSILEGYPIGCIYVQSSNDKFLWLLDGKQRWSTIEKFINGDFPLSLNTPDTYIEYADGKVELYDELGGKRFSELPKELQEEILEYDIDIIEMKNITNEQRDEMFQRLNNGMPLTKTELTNAIAGTDILGFVKDVLKTEFFSNMVAIAPSYRLRHVDVEMVEQIMLLMMRKSSTAIDPDTLREFVKDLKEVKISDEFKEQFHKVTAYLEESFMSTKKVLDGENEKDVRILEDKDIKFILKKVHTPMIFLRAIDAVERGISPERFAKWVHLFFRGDKERKIKGYKSGEGTYGKACSSGSAKVDAVTNRIEAMTGHYNKYFKLGEHSEAARQEAEAGLKEAGAGKEQE